VTVKPSEALESLPFTVVHCYTVTNDPYLEVNHKPCAIITYIHTLLYLLLVFNEGLWVILMIKPSELAQEACGCNLDQGSHFSVCFKTKENQENLCRVVGLQPAIWLLKLQHCYKNPLAYEVVLFINFQS
jgi:hypothetical protein